MVLFWFGATETFPRPAVIGRCRSSVTLITDQSRHPAPPPVGPGLGIWFIASGSRHRLSSSRAFAFHGSVFIRLCICSALATLTCLFHSLKSHYGHTKASATTRINTRVNARSLTCCSVLGQFPPVGVGRTLVPEAAEFILLYRE